MRRVQPMQMLLVEQTDEHVAEVEKKEEEAEKKKQKK